MSKATSFSSYKESSKGAMDSLIFALIAFLLNKAVLFSLLSPFGMGFFTAVLRQRKDKVLPVFCCSFLALFLFSPFSKALIFSLPFVLMLILDRFTCFSKSSKLFNLTLTFILALGARLLVFFLIDRTSLVLISSLFDSCLVLFTAYLFELFVPFLANQGEVKRMGSEEVLCCILMLIGIITGTAGIQIASISLQNVLSRYVILFFALSGLGVGTVVGVTVGAVTLLTDHIDLGMISFHSLSGMLGGLGRDLGKPGVIAGFLTGNFLLFLYLDSSFQPTVFFLESGLACLLFLLTPSQKINFVYSLVGSKEEEKQADPAGIDLELQDLTVKKVEQMTEVFKQLAQTYAEISCGQEQEKESPAAKLLNSLAERVCSSCSASRICWEKEFYKTYQIFFDLLTMKGRDGLTAEQIPVNFKRRCSRIKEIVTTLNFLLEKHDLNSYWESRMVENRNIVLGQLNGIAQIMNNLAEELQLDTAKQLEMEQSIMAVLRNNRIRFEQLAISGLDTNKLEISMTRLPCVGSGECRKRIAPLISHALGEDFRIRAESCGLKDDGGTCSFKLYPSRPYRAEYGVAKAVKENESVSGDNYSVLELRNGRYLLFLSDGMGCGRRAAKQSSAAISLLKQLMEVGFSQELAVRTANSILVLNSPEESFATLDLFIFDQYSAQAELIKIGSSPSFLKRNDQIKTIKFNSLPIGILNNLEFCSIKQQLQDEDLIVMVSDGVLDSRRDLLNKEDWIVRVLQRIDCTDPQSVADYILERAVRYSGGRIGDDMTVIALKIKGRVGFS